MHMRAAPAVLIRIQTVSHKWSAQMAKDFKLGLELCGVGRKASHPLANSALPHPLSRSL